MTRWRVVKTLLTAAIVAVALSAPAARGAGGRDVALPVGAVAGKAITTIEGLAAAGGQALQRAWIEQQVPQCGYCQSGMLMAAAALLREHPTPNDEDIDRAMTNICRCGTYPRVRLAIKQAAAAGSGK